MSEKPPYLRLITVPFAITLAVTLLRLTGELLDWSPALFNREAGGGGAVVGIVWLVPVFGIYFALKLLHMGYAPSGLGRVFGWAAAGLLTVVLVAVAGSALKLGTVASILVFSAASVVATVLALRGWRELGVTLVWYGAAARIPVAVVMLMAMVGGWGTHYDAPPPNLPEMGVVPRFLLIGLLPQVTLWIAFTVVFGAVFGALAVAVARMRTRPATA